jgi:hypothetical protein
MWCHLRWGWPYIRLQYIYMKIINALYDPCRRVVGLGKPLVFWLPLASLRTRVGHSMGHWDTRWDTRWDTGVVGAGARCPPHRPSARDRRFPHVCARASCRPSCPVAPLSRALASTLPGTRSHRLPSRVRRRPLPLVTSFFACCVPPLHKCCASCTTRANSSCASSSDFLSGCILLSGCK